VDRVQLDIRRERVDVWVVHEEGQRWSCPECGIALSVYDHAPERSWRHLDTCQFRTFLHARIPRVQCPTHGVRQVKVSWAEEHSRFTALFERLAILVLKETSLEGAGKVLLISWVGAWHIMGRAGERGSKRKLRRPVKAVARMFRKYLKHIITFFPHRITNAVSEALNSTIQTIKKRAWGFRNRHLFSLRRPNPSHSYL